MSHKKCFEKREQIRAQYDAAIWAAIDILPRFMCEEVSPRVFRCRECKGHDAGECGVSHAVNCHSARALRLACEAVGYKSSRLVWKEEAA